MPNDNPMEQLTRLGQLLRDEADKLGLDLQHFSPLPDLSGGGEHSIQAYFVVRPAEPKEAEDQPTDYDDVLAGIEAATKEAEQERLQADALARSQAISERLQKKGGGFLDDD